MVGAYGWSKIGDLDSRNSEIDCVGYLRAYACDVVNVMHIVSMLRPREVRQCTFQPF